MWRCVGQNCWEVGMEIGERGEQGRGEEGRGVNKLSSSAVRLQYLSLYHQHELQNSRYFSDAARKTHTHKVNAMLIPAVKTDLYLHGSHIQSISNITFHCKNVCSSLNLAHMTRWLHNFVYSGGIQVVNPMAEINCDITKPCDMTLNLQSILRCVA